MKLTEWLKTNQDKFSQRDLRFLLKTLWGREFTGLTPKEDVFLDPFLLSRLTELREKYCLGMPLPYLINREEFYGLSFYVDEKVLIPRKETELVAEKAGEYGRKIRAEHVLDLCCGSGVIAICLKKLFLSQAEIFASDISPAALEVAGKNIREHKADITLVCSDLFSGFSQGSFDLIVTNPPYVETSLIKGSLTYEPEIALNGSSDGLKVLRKIIKSASCYLRPGGYIIIEIGAFQKNKLERLVSDSGSYIIEEWFKDYSGLWRGAVLRKKRVPPSAEG